MKLILITLVAVVVGMMALACTATPATPAAPTATPPPAFSDAEVSGAVRGHLMAPGTEQICRAEGMVLASRTPRVRQDPSNRDKYLVTVANSPDLSWTFIGSLGKVFSTSKGIYATFGC